MTAADRGDRHRPAPDGRRGQRNDSRPWPQADDGVVIIDKPAGWTSHDVVAKVRYLAKTRKVGHAGTLDPMATGVLLVGIGSATRLLTYLSGADKEYVATIRLGETTVSDDADGERIAANGAVPAAGLSHQPETGPHDGRGDARRVDDAAVVAAAAQLTGPIMQVPAAVSAIKVAGKRAYARVRDGQDVALAARPVVVSAFEVEPLRGASTADNVPVVDVDARVECSSGTYIRALARDLGEALGTGGHLTRLRRTRVGGYGLDGARGIDELVRLCEAGEPLPVVDLAEAARRIFPTRTVTAQEARELRFGRSLTANPDEGRYAAILETAGAAPRLIAIVANAARRDCAPGGSGADSGPQGWRARPVTVFAGAPGDEAAQQALPGAAEQA